MTFFFIAAPFGSDGIQT